MGKRERATGERSREGVRVGQIHAAAAGGPHVADEERRVERVAIGERGGRVALLGVDRLLDDRGLLGRDRRQPPAVAVASPAVAKSPE